MRLWPAVYRASCVGGCVGQRELPTSRRADGVVEIYEYGESEYLVVVRCRYTDQADVLRVCGDFDVAKAWARKAVRDES